MKDIIGGLALLFSFLMIYLRTNIQIQAGKMLKDDEYFNKIGIDKFLFLFPEITPLNHIRESLDNKISD
ncbi:MAG: hypothetical protein IJL80_04720, partial [Treponema sp.]|nr:hypothetical protein [Treponema sp.]